MLNYLDINKTGDLSLFIDFILYVELLYNYFYSFIVLFYKYYKVIIYVKKYKYGFTLVKYKV